MIEIMEGGADPRQREADQRKISAENISKGGFDSILALGKQYLNIDLDFREHISVRYLTDMEPLEQHGDWIDLRAAEDVFIEVFDSALIPLGVAMQLPPGCEAVVAARSSTFKTWGIILANGIGIIDNGYNGNNDQWYFPAICLRGKTVQNGRAGTVIHKNDRIAQFRIFKNQPAIALDQVESLRNPDRGGLGSTGSR